MAHCLDFRSLVGTGSTLKLYIEVLLAGRKCIIVSYDEKFVEGAISY